MNGKTLRRVLGYLRPYRATLAAACAGALASVLFTLLGPVFTGRAIDCIFGRCALSLPRCRLGAVGGSRPVADECRHAHALQPRVQRYA